MGELHSVIATRERERERDSAEPSCLQQMKYDSDAEHVTLFAVSVALTFILQNLWCHEARRSNMGVDIVGVIHILREAEVDDLQIIEVRPDLRGKHQILRLEVPVHDAKAMDVLHASKQLLHDVFDYLIGKIGVLVFLQLFLQTVLVVQKLCDKEVRILLFIRGNQFHAIFMLQLSQDFQLIDQGLLFFSGRRGFIRVLKPNLKSGELQNTFIPTESEPRKMNVPLPDRFACNWLSEAKLKEQLAARAKFLVAMR